MLGISLPINWSQISEEIPLSLVIMSHKKWDSGEGRREKKKWGVPYVCNRTPPPMNWSQISAEIPSSFIIIFHRVWNGEDDGSGEKGGGFQMSITVAAL